MLRFLLSAALLLSAHFLLATHNRSGYIRYEQTASLSIRAEIITYTRASSRPADRDTLTICWGDDHCEKVLRSNGTGNPPEGETLDNDMKYNVYMAEHTYDGRGTYVISMTDPNRDAGILNVNPPNSEQIAFHLQATVTLLEISSRGANQSPVILSPPIDLATAGSVFTYHPNAYDVDGDSIAYELTAPMQGVNEPVERFFLPNEIDPGGNNIFTMDPVTGQLTWDTPQMQGKYNVAIRFKSYRDDELIDEFVLEMEILVVAGSPTNIEEAEWARNQIGLYPNPVNNGVMTVNFRGFVQPLRYRILDITGTVLERGYLNASQSRVDLDGKPAGNYVLSVEYRAGQWAGKPFVLIE